MPRHPQRLGDWQKTVALFTAILNGCVQLSTADTLSVNDTVMWINRSKLFVWRVECAAVLFNKPTFWLYLRVVVLCSRNHTSSWWCRSFGLKPEIHTSSSSVLLANTSHFLCMEPSLSSDLSAYLTLCQFILLWLPTTDLSEYTCCNAF